MVAGLEKDLPLDGWSLPARHNVSSALGLYYYRARYYHTDLQRFIAEDPLGFGGGDVNLYGYVANNPIGSRDPFGLRTIIIHGGVPSMYWWAPSNGAENAGLSVLREELQNAGEMVCR